MPSPSASSETRRLPRQPRIGVGAGGYDFLEDPNKTGLEASVFWRADVLARHVRLAPAPEGLATGSLIRYEPERWGGRQTGRFTPDGYHLIVAPARGIELRDRGVGVAADADPLERHARVEEAPDGEIGRASCRERVFSSV